MPPVAENDFEVPMPLGYAAAVSMSLDDAIEEACKKLGFPILGGTSGPFGWSAHSAAQKCPHLFFKRYDDAKVEEERAVAAPLQIGGLFHALTALFYGAGMYLPAYKSNGLIAGDLLGKKRFTSAVIPPDAADQLLVELKAMAHRPGENIKTPAISLILETERLFDAHTSGYEAREDVQPLAIEWLAIDEKIPYSCRYDMIGRVGPRDKDLEEGVWIFERKTAAWLNEMVLEGWAMDGEILGELLLWERCGLSKIFGPLKGLVVDIVTKEKQPKLQRVLLPAGHSYQTERHLRWLRTTGAQIMQWRANGVYPQHFANCITRYGKCDLYLDCLMSTSLNGVPHA